MVKRVMACDGGCGRQLTWEGRPTQAVMEQQARDKGWHAPDRLGQHYCLNCRSRAGAEQWWRRENVRQGLPAGYGLGECRCDPSGPSRPDCVSAGHPGVEHRV
jgi:hypothetical protein